MEKTLKEILKEGPRFDEYILRQAEKSRLVFFIGAGVSRIMGIPGWSDLSSDLIKKAFPEYRDYSTILRDVPDSKERITIAYKKFENENKLDEFYRIFGEAMKPNQKVFNSKQNIYKILNRFHATFLTTNADNLFEEILGSTLCHEECESTVIRDEHFRRQNHLFYLHGHYIEEKGVDNKLVFAAQQYVERYNDEEFVEFLKTIFYEDNAIIFVGYGLNEFELIDYIVTKVNLAPKPEPKVYVLYGFCEDEEIMYQAKKSYFEALNIKIIPYDITKKGYDSLIGVLEKLYEDCRKKTIVPMTENIHEWVSEYNIENRASIIRLLKDENLASTTEQQIVREIKKANSFSWVKYFCEEQLFTSEQLDKKLSYKAWPLLELLVEWLKSDDENAQDEAIRFLNQITSKQQVALSKNYTFITKEIVEIILALDRHHIKSKYLNLMESVTSHNSSCVYVIAHLETSDRIVQWNTRYIRKLLDFMFKDVDLDAYHDNHSYYIEHFFKKFNAVISNENVAKFIFEYFIKLIICSKDDDYYLFIHIRDIDNVYKNHKSYWKLALTEIKFCFAKMSSKRQRNVVKNLLAEEDELSWKLALYLARKYNHNISNLIVNSKFVSSYSCFHEYYLLLEHQIKNEYISVNVQRNLCFLFGEAKFGINKYRNQEDATYYDNLILSKRLLLLQTLSCDESCIEAKKLLEKNITPYDSKEVAEQCDYVHSAVWGPDTQFDSDIFKGIAVETWSNKLNEICGEITDNYEISHLTREFVNFLFERNEEEINVVITSFKELQNNLLASVIHAVGAHVDKLNSTEVLVNTCLDILDSLINISSIDRCLIKNIFSLLSKIKRQSKENIVRTLTSIRPWLSISIDEEEAFSGGNHFLTNLINYGDFDKFSVLLNCFVFLKKNDGHDLDEEEIEMILKNLEQDSSKRVFRHTLCYNYQNLKYISKDKSFMITDELLKENVLDMSSLLLCTLNSQYVFEELVEAIKNNYLSGRYSIPEECKDGMLTDHFYDFIIASRHFNLLTKEDIVKAYIHPEFTEHLLRNFSTWNAKENFAIEEWLTSCWKYIKVNYDLLKQKQFAEMILHSIDDISEPTEVLLDLYIDVARHCNKSSSIYVQLSNVVVFFEVNKVKTFELISEIVEKVDFIDEDELEDIIKKCAEVGLGTKTRVLLNDLCDNGKISLNIRDELGKKLQ